MSKDGSQEIFNPASFSGMHNSNFPQSLSGHESNQDLKREANYEQDIVLNQQYANYPLNEEYRAD